MKGIEKITSKILAEAEDYRRVSAEQAQFQINDIEEKLTGETDYAVALIKSRADREAEDIALRSQSSASIAKRNIILGAKGELLDEAFKRAAGHVRAMPAGDYKRLLARLLASALRSQLQTEREAREIYGEETAGGESAVFEVMFNKADRAIGADVILETVELCGGDVPAQVMSSLKVSETAVAIDGGFIMKRGGVEINCSISLMLARLREGMEAEVYRCLFG